MVPPHNWLFKNEIEIMGRPARNNCDYYPHANNMRNHRKIKALRNKFSVINKYIGYAFWSMFLEYLTELDGNVFEYSEFECELFAAELGVSVTEIRDMIDFCIKIELLFLNDGHINSPSLDEKLSPVYEKRNRLKGLSASQKRRKDGKYGSNSLELGFPSTDTTVVSVVSVTDSPQLNITKLNKIELNKTNAVVFEEIKKYFGFESEIKHVEKWFEINAFLNELEKEKKIEYFKHQFEFYKKYKEESKEKTFGFQSFLNNGWNAENWELKLIAHRKNNENISGKLHSGTDKNKERTKQENERLEATDYQKENE